MPTSLCHISLGLLLAFGLLSCSTSDDAPTCDLEFEVPALTPSEVELYFVDETLNFERVTTFTTKTEEIIRRQCHYAPPGDYVLTDLYVQTYNPEFVAVDSISIELKIDQQFLGFKVIPEVEAASLCAPLHHLTLDSVPYFIPNCDTVPFALTTRAFTDRQANHAIKSVQLRGYSL